MSNSDLPWIQHGKSEFKQSFADSLPRCTHVL